MRAGSENSHTELSFDVFRQFPILLQQDVALSRGFLRCRPEKWFPGFASHWLPLWHSLGIDARLVEIKTAMRAGKSMGKGFYGMVDGERVAICLDGNTEELILGAISPGVNIHAGSVILEYLARRFFASIGLSWSAAENAKVQFQREIETHSFNEAGAVKISFSLNNNLCTTWVLLGATLVDRLDGLWRRQLQSQQKTEANSQQTACIEFLNVELNASELKGGLSSGSFLSLGKHKIDIVQLNVDGKPFLPAKLCMVEDKIGLQIQGMATHGTSVSGPNTLKLCSPTFDIASDLMPEIAQTSSVFVTPLQAQPDVSIYLQDRKVAEGRIAYSLGSLGVLIN